jgi:hypothetical protein
MSFFEQERALFDLLFDTPLREKFIKNSTTALSDYSLSAEELADFAVYQSPWFSLRCSGAC